MKFNTKCVHGSGKPDSTGAISPAIYMSSTFSHPQLGDTTGYQYTRESNPTRDRLEQLIAGLEEGTDALAFSSGMAAVDAVFHLFSPGDHIILGDDLYGFKSQGDKISRVMLHAYMLYFIHPRTGKRVEFTAKTYDDFNQIIYKKIPKEIFDEKICPTHIDTIFSSFLSGMRL